MKKFVVSVGCTLAVLVATNVAVAQGRGSGGGPKPKVTAGAPKGGGSIVHGGGKGIHSGAKTTTPHVTARGGGKAHGAGVKSTHGGARPTTAGPKPKSTTTTAAKTAPKTTKKTQTTTATTGTLTPVQLKLQRNTNLASKLESRLPKGTDLMAASEGFRNLGQFVAAVNVSHNHDLDFTKLKTAMVDEGMSLGQAMKEQRSSLDGTVEANRAQNDADIFIRSTETTSVVPAQSKARTPTAKERRR
jgi:hypothetical protein